MQKQPSKNGKIIGGIVLICLGIIMPLAYDKNDAAEARVATALCVILILVGIVLLILGFRNRKKFAVTEKKQKELEEARIRVEKARLEAEEARYKASSQRYEDYSNSTWVCKQCGATTKGNYCEYCGSKKA